jgi:hypothetical protein
MREKSTSGCAVRNSRVIFQVFQRLFMLPKNPTVNQQVLRMGGVGNRCMEKRWRCKEAKEQAEQLEIEQYESSKHKNKIFKNHDVSSCTW